MKRFFTLLHKVKTWQLLLATLVFFFLSIWLLRQNNLHMVNLREEAVQLDAAGDIEALEPKLEELRDHVVRHMNTNMGGKLELPGTYNLAVEAIRLEVERSGGANSQVYADAQRVCEDPSVLLQVRAQCIQEYVTSNAAPGTVPQELVFPDKALYSYSFISPVWSPDIAGFSLLISLLLMLSLLAKLVAGVLLPALNRWIDADPLE